MQHIHSLLLWLLLLPLVVIVCCIVLLVIMHCIVLLVFVHCIAGDHALYRIASVCALLVIMWCQAMHCYSPGLFLEQCSLLPGTDHLVRLTRPACWHRCKPAGTQRALHCLMSCSCTNCWPIYRSVDRGFLLQHCRPVTV